MRASHFLTSLREMRRTPSRLSRCSAALLLLGALSCGDAPDSGASSRTAIQESHDAARKVTAMGGPGRSDRAAGSDPTTARRAEPPSDQPTATDARILGDPSARADAGPHAVCASTADCADGYCTFATGACLDPTRAPTGLCAARPEGCADVIALVCGCDGHTYGNECEAAVAGQSIAYGGRCKEDIVCRTNTDCPGGSYCALSEGSCRFQSDPGANVEGLCTPLSETCPGVVAEVCGCDGRTYLSACEAAHVGVNVYDQGCCLVEGGKLCRSEADCTSTEYCAAPAGTCGDQAGSFCQPRPENCPGDVNPVCGCDKQTYSNACMAAAAGVRVSSPTKCAADQ